jgi:hypothetical protein
MASQINPPVKGGDIGTVWRTVAELCAAVNALREGKVMIEKLGHDEQPSGRIMPAEGNTVLHLRLPHGGGLRLVTDEEGHQVKDVRELQFQGYNSEVAQQGDNKDQAYINVFPDTDELDTSKKYALVAEYDSDAGDWGAEWKEICSS